MNTRSVLFSCIFLLCASCGQKKVVTTEETAEVRTPVTVTTITYAPLEDFIEFNATSAFLQKIVVKATTTGYIKSSAVKYGSNVRSGQGMFTIKTKEAESIGNTINKLDPTFKFSGMNTVKAAASGYVTELDHQVAAVNLKSRILRVYAT